MSIKYANKSFEILYSRNFLHRIAQNLHFSVCTEEDFDEFASLMELINELIQDSESLSDLKEKVSIILIWKSQQHKSYSNCNCYSLFKDCFTECNWK